MLYIFISLEINNLPDKSAYLLTKYRATSALLRNAIQTNDL